MTNEHNLLEKWRSLLPGRKGQKVYFFPGGVFP